MARWHSCNILQAGHDFRNLWQFSVGGKFALQQQHSKLPSEALPQKAISKDWQTLLQPKLNVALLPTEKVFLRVVQLPKADFTETQSMVELQLEKLSPLPVAQVVWGFELLSSGQPGMQTAIVIIVARSYVEEFLNLLEGQGFLADRLEVPFLDLLRATQIKEDGAWLYTDGTGDSRTSCLVAWWYGGTLQHLSLLHLPANENFGPILQAQLGQMAWAGEFEGWLTSTPRFHLVANEQTAAAWKPFFKEDQPLELVKPLSAPELAALTAKRVATEDLHTNLLPPEYSARYRQQFIDRLWMRGLGAVLLIYIAGAALYLGWVQFAKWQNSRVEDKIAALSSSYTNALALKERVRVLQEQRDLQFMALDCWKAVADSLPSELTLKSLNFERGQRLSLMGVASSGDVSKVQEFNDAMRKFTLKDQLLFKKVEGPRTTTLARGQSSWAFICELQRVGIDTQ